MNPQDIPVLLIIFNRPDKVSKLIDVLSEIQPKKIYIIADGPRPHVPSDVQTSTAARKAAIDIPWECEVHTKFLDENLRSRHCALEYSAVLGLDWFFKENEVGIILEDDCIPDPTFFSFCGELLERYKDDEKIMHISGDNFQDGIQRGDGSYYYSLYTHSWGWATWKRAWDTFHPAVTDMDQYMQEHRIATLPITKAAQRFWTKSYTSKRHWDSLWQYTVWHENGLSIIPNQNLVTNIGFGADATNTHEKNNPLANMSTSQLKTVTHPSVTELHTEADSYIFKKSFYTPLHLKVSKKIQSTLRKWYNAYTK